ncbi:MAG: energy-coupling factor transporter transmembrane protein EcfT [Candidatus Eremiobacteraeota bacterium]|nr:energy-coupling factor transporter transmembrane protein EcfT [Candidatus Eremiobacteraeota bacterium]
MELVRNISIGVYVDTDSAIHRLDPRLKILILAALMILVFVFTRWHEFMVLFALLVFVAILSRIPLRFIWRGFRMILFFILLAVVFNLFLTRGGDVIFSWRFITITTEGAKLAGLMAARLIILVLGTSLLTLTTSYLQLTDALESLLKPFRRIGVPAHEIAMMMTIALRFIPTLLEETEKIIKAQTSRGAEFDQGNIIKRVRLLLPILIPLFVHAFRVAEDLAVAMEARCYRGGEGRTRLRQLVFTRTDLAVSIGVILLLGLMTGGEIWFRAVSK